MSNLNVFKQPKQFYLIFSIEFWERFGFYGMQAILAVYLVKILGMSESESFVLFGAFSALIFGSSRLSGESRFYLHKEIVRISVAIPHSFD